MNVAPRKVPSKQVKKTSKSLARENFDTLVNKILNSGLSNSNLEINFYINVQEALLYQTGLKKIEILTMFTHGTVNYCLHYL